MKGRSTTNLRIKQSAVLLLKEDKGYSGFEFKYRANVDERQINRIAPLNKAYILSKEDVGYNERTTIFPVDILLALLSASERNL